MSALTLFPLQFQRQDSVPIDIDQTFSTTAARMTYLTSPRRYAGQVVADTELNECYFLDSSRSIWILIGSVLQFQDEGSNLGGSDANTLNLVGNGVTATRNSNTVTVNIPGGGGGGYTAVNRKWAQWPLGNSCTIVWYQDDAHLDQDIIPPPLRYLGESQTEDAPPIGEFYVLGLQPYLSTGNHVITWFVTTTNLSPGQGDPATTAYEPYAFRSVEGRGITAVPKINSGVIWSEAPSGRQEIDFLKIQLDITCQVDGVQASNIITLVATPDVIGSSTTASPGQVVYSSTSVTGGVTIPANGSVNLGNYIYSTEDWTGSGNSTVSQLGTLSATPYVFTPYEDGTYGPYMILYTIHYQAKLILTEAIRNLTLYGKRSDGTVLFRKDVMLFQNDAGYFTLSSAFEYLHVNSSIPIYLTIADNSGDSTTVKLATGSWTIEEISRISPYMCTFKPPPFIFRDNFNGPNGTLSGRTTYPGPGTWATTTFTAGTISNGTLSGPGGSNINITTTTFTTWIQVGFLVIAAPSTGTGRLSLNINNSDSYLVCAPSGVSPNAVFYGHTELALSYETVSGSMPSLANYIGNEVSFRFPFAPNAVYQDYPHPEELRAEVCSVAVAGNLEDQYRDLPQVTSSASATIAFSLAAGYTIGHIWIKCG